MSTLSDKQEISGAADDAPADITLRILMIADRRPTHATTVLEHIEALSGASRHHVYCLNSRGWTAPGIIPFDGFDVVVIHYSISIIHEGYLPASFRARIRAFQGLKAMLIQDEYREVDAYIGAMLDLGIEVLFTSVPDKSIDRVYARLRRAKVDLFPTLTGFVSEQLARMPVRPLAERPFDLVYRGRPVPFELGDLGWEKTDIAIRANELSARRGLAVDVDWREEARIYGDRWIDFMSSGRATLGTESGASIVDFDRSIATAVESYRASHPDAGYREVAEAVLRPYEGNIVINTISPRAFEAICLGTALVLFPGEYSGILEPGHHYIPLAKDFSNFAEVAGLLRDIGYLERLTRRARTDIVDSGRYTFGAFARTVDDTLARQFALRHPKSARLAADRPPQDRESWRRELDRRVARVAHPEPRGRTEQGGATSERGGALQLADPVARKSLSIRAYGAVCNGLRRLIGR
jgi:hypothetical protein